MKGGYKMNNELHIRPSHSFNRYKFITVEQCSGCGVIADEYYYYMGDDVCPNCGHGVREELATRWEDDESEESGFVWYNPFSWFESLIYPSGKWVIKKIQ